MAILPAGSGNDLLFSTLAEENLETISQSKAVKSCSASARIACTHDERGLARGRPGRSRIEHHSELLDRYKTRLPVNSGKERDNVVYHRSVLPRPLSRCLR